MSKTLLIFPTPWDAPQLAAAGLEAALGDPGDDCADDFDVLGYIDRLCADGGVGAIASSSDYPGPTATAAIATRLGLPGSTPEAAIRASHKYYSRLVQREVVPEATPAFWLVDPAGPPPPIEYPCFIKPVKGAFSVMTGKLESEADLRAFLARPAARRFLDSYVTMFNAMAAALAPVDVNASFFIAEEYLPGRQSTLDGWCADGDAHVLGIVDSIVDERTRSFTRFEYPSTLPASVQARMAEIARRLMPRLGLRWTMFNIEMNWNPATDRIHIIEVNPRISGQFGDLYQKVDGTNAYEVMLSLSRAERPTVRRDGDGVAASVPLRVYEPCRVTRAPSAERIADVMTAFPGTLVWSKVREGQSLADFETAEDGRSFRYAVINAGAESRAALEAKIATVRDALGYAFERFLASTFPKP